MHQIWMPKNASDPDASVWGARELSGVSTPSPCVAAILSSGEVSCDSLNNLLILPGGRAAGGDFAGLVLFFAVLFFEEYIIC